MARDKQRAAATYELKDGVRARRLAVILRRGDSAVRGAVLDALVDLFVRGHHPSQQPSNMNTESWIFAYFELLALAGGVQQVPQLL